MKYTILPKNDWWQQVFTQQKWVGFLIKLKQIWILSFRLHARKDNPELLRGQELGLKIYSYPEFIFEHSKQKTRVVVAGSHGKTTTTSMIMHVLKACKTEYDYLVGLC